MLLSKVYEQKLAAEDHEATAIIQRISPVAWQHVNLFGKFEFSVSTPRIDIDALAARYADQVYWAKAMKDIQEEPIA